MAGEYVDLGLSVKWATMNIGAERVIYGKPHRLDISKRALRLSFFMN